MCYNNDKEVDLNIIIKLHRGGVIIYLYNLNIYRVINIEEKSKIVREVILDLPDWIQVSDEMEKYIEDAKELPLWVAKNDEETIGFLTLRETSKDTCEIHAVGVKEVYQDLGVGKKLYYACEDYAKENYEYMQVKLLKEDFQEKPDANVGFFKSLGFKKLETFKTIWDSWNPVLIMVKKI